MVDLDAVVSDYIRKNPREVPHLGLLLTQLDDEEVMNDRRNFHGHVTGSGIVLASDKNKILLIHHKLFNRWQQPGGHWESDEEADPLEVARREVEEETGLTNLRYIPVDDAQPLVPIDIDTHAVPARPAKDEPDHFHHDFRYVFISSSDEVTAEHDDGVSDARWFSFDEPECKHVEKILAKLRAQGIIPAA